MFADSDIVEPDAYRQPLGSDVATQYDTFSCNSQNHGEKSNEVFTSTYDWSYVCNICGSCCQNPQYYCADVYGRRFSQ